MKSWMFVLKLTRPGVNATNNLAATTKTLTNALEWSGTTNFNCKKIPTLMRGSILIITLLRNFTSTAHTK